MNSDSAKLPGDDDEWIISIGGGYGSFLFRGNEADAEHMRAGKAQWEGAAGAKWRVEDATCGGAQGQRLEQRQQMQVDALEFAERYPRSVATWRNYGRATNRNGA